MSELKKPARKIWIVILLLVMMLGIIIWFKENKDLFQKKRVLSIDDPDLVKTITVNQTKLLVIGIDALTWQILTDLMGKGELPNFRKVIEQGARGVMHSEEPMISPGLWTTFATGVAREKHKIDNFVFKPVGSYEPEIMDSRVREAPALWEILSHYGKKVAVVNWNSGTPAERINGIFIAEGARQDNLSPEKVYPREWREKLNKMPLVRVKWFEELLKKWEHPMPEKGYQEDLFIASAGIEILKSEEPDLMMIYFRNLDMVSHLFWKYRWPVGVEYQFQVSDQERERFGDVIEKYYQLMDELVGRLLEASPGYTVMLFSDHGQSATYPPKNIFVELNLLLHQLGFLEYNLPRCEDVLGRMEEDGLYQSEEPAKDIFFDCEFLRRQQFSTEQDLEKFLIAKRRLGAENLVPASDLLKKLYLSLSNPQLTKEINWQRTKLFNIEDFHKNLRGIYLNLKTRDPKGVIEFQDYERTRKNAIQILSSLQNEKGEKFFKVVKANPAKKKPIAEGPIDPADILVEFNPEVLAGQYIFRGKGDREPFFISLVLWSYQDVSGDHFPEGVIIVSGKDAVAGQRISARIYDVAPTILWLFDAGIGEDMPGAVLESAFVPSGKSIKYVSSYSESIKIPVSYKSKAMSEEEREKLKAVGYIK